MNNIKVENIRKATVNGRNVKLFDVRTMINGAWVFRGTFSAPARTANHKLLDHI